jgi:hypothetical protein
MNNSLVGIIPINDDLINSPFINGDIIMFLLREGFTIRKSNAMKTLEKDGRHHVIRVSFGKIRIFYNGTVSDGAVHNSTAFKDFPFTNETENPFTMTYNKMITELIEQNILT